MRATVWTLSENGLYCSSEERVQTVAGVCQLWLCRESFWAYALPKTSRLKRSYPPSNSPIGAVHFGAKIPVGSRHNLIQLNEPGD